MKLNIHQLTITFLWRCKCKQSLQDAKYEILKTQNSFLSQIFFSSRINFYKLYQNLITIIKIGIEDEVRFVKRTGKRKENKAAEQCIKRVEIDEEGAKQKKGSTGHLFSTQDCTAVFCGQFDKT